MTTGTPDAVLTGGRAPGARSWYRSVGTTIWTFVKNKPLGALGAALLLFMGGTAVFADLMPYGPLETSLREIREGPTWEHLAGTDGLGRDLLTRIFHGSRVTLKIGFLGLLIGVSAGTIVGITSGYFGGLVDILFQRVIDALMAFPVLILALALASIRNPSDNNTILIIGIVFIPTTSRIVRGATLTVKNNVYIEASRALGASNARIILRHILPNITAPIIVIASVFLGAAIIVEATLSFLGVGGSIERPSWGGMLTGSARTNLESAWWLAFFPGLALAMTIYSINIFGDALRDVLDPRLRGTGAGRYGK